MLNSRPQIRQSFEKLTWVAGTALACVALLGSGAVPARAQTLLDPTLVVESVTTGLAQPTTMAFVGPDDILVLEKQTGWVRRVLSGVLEPSPVLVVTVNAEVERGLLGIAVNSESPPGVFLYFTEADTPGGTPIGNRVYRYDWNAQSGLLQNPVLVLDLPALPGWNHAGGILTLGPPGESPGVGDGALLHAVIGDLWHDGQLQNYPAGPLPDDTSVILRIRQDGTPAPGNPFTPYCSATTTTTCTDNGDCPVGESCRVEVARYFAYGVRNSFGLAIDPVTGDLWETENGRQTYDEVNRVEPGMNSGWESIMGPQARNPLGPGDLFDLPGAGTTYNDPEFSWFDTIGPTSIAFLYGSSLGAEYDDIALVGDTNLGQLYALPLNPMRDGLALTGIPGLADLVADDDTERDALLFGEAFGVTTDLEVGPDGHLYVVSLSNGAIYRIRGPVGVPALPTWGPALLVLVLPATALLGLLGSHARRRALDTSKRVPTVHVARDSRAFSSHASARRV
jgi:glucose/arabinose dehydrogenase